MPLSLSGRLTTPFGDPLPNAVIRFDAVRTSGAVLSYTNAQATTDNSGDYAISVEYGTYDIRVKTSQSFYTLATSVQINSDNTESDLNALLVAHTGNETLTPQIILDFQALRDESIAAQQSASADAEQTALDRVATGEDRQQTGLDRVATGEDAAATAADRIATGEDRQAVAADLEQTGLDRVATGEDAAATAADRIATGEDADATAADRVATGEDRTAADESALEAKHWANYPIDSPVPEGDGTELSSRHWADISRQRAVNAMVAQGAWDASTGTLPPEPAGASYWLVTGAANGVTINSVEYRNKDMLLWTPGDGGGGSWSKIDNTDSVTSVANKTGAVELTPSDVGADPAGAAQSAQDHAIQRGNHTGTQPLNTISDAGSAASKNTGTEAGQVPLNSDLGTAAKKNTGTGAADVPTTGEADGRYVRLSEAQYLGTPIGDTIALPTHLAGIDLPPTDNPLFRYVLLTAGENGAGGYNEGVMVNESVSGSAPLVEATAEIEDSESPINGETISLWNTERRYTRASDVSGEKENSKIGQHRHNINVYNVSGSVGLNDGPGAIAVENSRMGRRSTPDDNVVLNTAVQDTGGSETRVRGETRVYLMRIR